MARAATAWAWATVVALLATLLSPQAVGARQRQLARPPGVGTATIAGVVVENGEPGAPVRRAMVRVNGGGLSVSTATDDQGRFALTRLPAGSFMITVSKAAWVTSYYGASRPGVGPGTQIALGDGEQKLDLVVPIVRGAVIAGRIIDGFGQPMMGERPVLMTTADRGGRRVLTIMGAGRDAGATNARGEFRIFGLAPGTYYVGVTPRGPASARIILDEEVRWAESRAGSVGLSDAQGPPAPLPGPAMGFPPVYYPGTIDVAAATPITLEPGDERTGVVIPMQFVRMSAITGAMVRADGERIGQSILNLISADSAVSPLHGGTIRATTRADGSFQFPVVPPGRYELWARASRVPGEDGSGTARPQPSPAQDFDLWASEEIVVTGQDITGLIVTLRPGMSIGGQVQLEAAPDSSANAQSMPDAEAFNGFGVTLRTPPDLEAGAHTVNLRVRPLETEGRFTFSGVPPGQYLVSGSGPSGWRTKSVLVDGVEQFDALIDIDEARPPSAIVVTMTNRVSALTGRLMDAADQPAPGYYVLVFSTDRSAWRQGSLRIRSMRPDGYGVFTFDLLPPGEYAMVALTDMTEVDWATPEVLEQFLDLAVRVTVVDGETTTQDIRIAR